MAQAPYFRALFLDQLRGFSIVLMVIFHFAYDLNSFRFVKIDFFRDPFWYYFPRLITFLFLLCVGISLCITHKKSIKIKKLIKRVAVLGFWAAIISVVTYFAFPKYWIYFGILHCITLCSLFGVFFIKIPRISGLLGLALLIPGVFFKINLPWIELPHPAMDYIPFFPWFGATLLGIFCHHIGLHELRTRVFKRSPLAYLGKHSLLIYLLHQPILYSLTYIVYWLTK